jgi:hypothetical protein
MSEPLLHWIAEKMLIGGEWVGLGAAVWTRDLSRMVVSL